MVVQTKGWTRTHSWSLPSWPSTFSFFSFFLFFSFRRLPRHFVLGPNLHVHMWEGRRWNSASVVVSCRQFACVGVVRFVLAAFVCLFCFDFLFSCLFFFLKRRIEYRQIRNTKALFFYGVYCVKRNFNLTSRLVPAAFRWKIGKVSYGSIHWKSSLFYHHLMMRMVPMCSKSWRLVSQYR